MQEKYGSSVKNVAAHGVKWIEPAGAGYLELQTETEVQTEESTFYLVHIFELDPHRLSSLALLVQRRLSESPILE